MSNGNINTLDFSDLGAALSAEDRAGLVDVLKNKIQSLTIQHTDFLENLTPNVRKRVEYLKELQSQHDELKAKFVEERTILEAKYEKLYEPLYTKRSGVVTGTVEVDGVTNDGKTDEGDKETEEKGVPNFWLTAMKKNEVLAEEITENDEEALKYLKDITCCRLDDPKGFKLTFFFDPNPFFKNSILTKSYQMINEDEELFDNAIGSIIEWFPGKCLTKKTLKKKPKKGSKSTKPITKTENCDSFFHFFNPPQIPDDDDDDDIDSEAAEELEDQIEQDLDMGCAIRQDIIPRAVSWYTGEAAHDDHVDDDDDDDDDDDEEEGEDIEEDEEVNV